MFRKYKTRIKYYIRNKHMKPNHLVVLCCALLFFTIGFSFLLTNVSVSGRVKFRAPANQIKVSSELGFRESDYLYDTISVTFNNTINIPNNALDVNDESTNENGSVMSYYLVNEDEPDYYDLYIESNGLIEANPNSSELFNYMYSMREFNNLEYLDTSNVTDMSYMFASCEEMRSFDISSLDTSKVTNMDSTFWDLFYLESFDASMLDTSNVTNMRCTFGGLFNCTYLNLGNIDTSKVTNMEMFLYCDEELEYVDLSGLDTSNVENMSNFFDRCKSMVNIPYKQLNYDSVTDISGFFSGCSSLKTVDLSCFNTSKIEDLTCFFSDCSSLESIDFTGFDTSKVIRMYLMFQRCTSLNTLDLSSFDTSNVSDMQRMFSGCSNLTFLDLSSFDTSKVTKFWSIFSDCTSLTSLDISNFNTSNCTDFTIMFHNCTSLETIVIPHYNPVIENTTEKLYGKSTSVYYSGTFVLHDHENSTRVEPTCDENGYILHTCSNHTVKDIIPATGHNYVDGVCSVCGKTEPSYTVIESPHNSFSTTYTHKVLGSWDYSSYGDYVDIVLTYEITENTDNYGLLIGSLDVEDGFSKYQNYYMLLYNGITFYSHASDNITNINGTLTTKYLMNVRMPKGTVAFSGGGTSATYYGIKVKVYPHTT